LTEGPSLFFLTSTLTPDLVLTLRMSNKVHNFIFTFYTTKTFNWVSSKHFFSNFLDVSLLQATWHLAEKD